MVQEKKMDSRLGPLDVVLYAAILSVHYPIRIVLASYRLIKAIIVKAASIPRQLFEYAITLLTLIQESLEDNLLNFLGKFKPARKTNAEIKNDPKSEEKYLTNYTEIFLSLVKRASDTTYGLLVAWANFWRHIVLLPLKLILIPLKAGKNLLATVLNISDRKPDMDRPQRQSVISHVGDYLYLIMASLQYHLITGISVIEKLMFQVSSLLTTSPRHFLDAIKLIYLRCLQLVALVVIFVYNVVRYSIFYVFILVNRALTKPKHAEVENDREALLLENSKLKEELAKNENQKCEQQIKDLEGQLSEVQVAFSREREEYKREIDKLKQTEWSTENANEFNAERTKLQDEIHQLQLLIAQVRKESEDEGRIKKQEAIDLDNERNQLQEQIQTLQQQVVSLQKQNEAMASSYSEARKEREMQFEKDRQALLREIEILQNKVAEMEEAQNEAKYRYIQLLGENQTVQEHMRTLQDSLEMLKRSNAAHRLKKNKPNCKNSDKGATNFTVINKNMTDFHYEIPPPNELGGGGAHFQTTIEEVIKYLDQMYHFNQERSLLHAEMEKLQALVEDIQKKNEERVNLDNERKEFFTLQEQVAELQNQNMIMALSYTEARRLMEAKFDGEREELLHQVQRLVNKVEGREGDHNQDKQIHVDGKNGTITNDENLQAALKILQGHEDGNFLTKLEDLCSVCKNIEREIMTFTETWQNAANLHYPQNAIDELGKVLTGLTDRLVAHIEVPQEETIREQVQALQDQLNEVLQKGRDNYEALEERNKVIDINMIVVKSQIDRIHDALHGMKAHLEMRDEKLDRLRMCHTRAVKVLKEEKSKVSNLRAQIDSMEKSIEESEDGKVMLQNSFVENEMKITAFERENLELKENTKMLQARLEEIEREHEHEEKLHNAAIADLERELEVLQTENYQKSQTFNEKLKELQTEKLHERDELINRLRIHHERAMKEFKEEKAQLVHLRWQVDSMAKSLQETQEQKLNLETALTESNLKLDHLTHENGELKQTIRRMEETHRNDEKLNAAVVLELQRELDAFEIEKEQREKLSEKMQELQTERVILLDQNMELQGLVEFLNKEVEKWKRAKRPLFGSK